MTDTLFRESFAEYVQGVDLLYHESTYGTEFEGLAKETFHSTQDKQREWQCLPEAKHLLLGHFSSRYPDPTPLLEQAREIFPNTDLCYDGAVFESPAVKRG